MDNSISGFLVAGIGACLIAGTLYLVVSCTVSMIRAATPPFINVRNEIARYFRLRVALKAKETRNLARLQVKISEARAALIVSFDKQDYSKYDEPAFIRKGIAIRV